MYTPLFITALLTIAKTWKQSKCPRTEKCIKKVWYIHTVEYYSAIKKNETMPFVAITDETRDGHSELRQTRRNTV